jgi:hypothetical protein
LSCHGDVAVYPRPLSLLQQMSPTFCRLTEYPPAFGTTGHATTGPLLPIDTVTANAERGSVCVFGDVLACCCVAVGPVLDDTTGSGFVGELGAGAIRDAGEFGAGAETVPVIVAGFGGAATGFGADVDTGITPVGTTSVGVPVANVAMSAVLADATVPDVAAIRSFDR